jgi:hypothetical protein
MIRIGNGPPRVYFVDDRWGQPTPYLSTNGYGYVDKQRWADLQTYQKGAGEPTPAELEEIRLLRAEYSPNQVKEFGDALALTAYGKRLKKVMDLSGQASTLWEFNAQATPFPDRDYIRFVAPLGMQHLYRWSDLDLITHKALVRFADAYNAVRRWFDKGTGRWRGPIAAHRPEGDRMKLIKGYMKRYFIFFITIISLFVPGCGSDEPCTDKLLPIKYEAVFIWKQGLDGTFCYDQEHVFDFSGEQGLRDTFDKTCTVTLNRQCSKVTTLVAECIDTTIKCYIDGFIGKCTQSFGFYQNLPLTCTYDVWLDPIK